MRCAERRRDLAGTEPLGPQGLPLPTGRLDGGKPLGIRGEDSGRRLTVTRRRAVLPAGGLETLGRIERKVDVDDPDRVDQVADLADMRLRAEKRLRNNIAANIDHVIVGERYQKTRQIATHRLRCAVEKVGELL